MRFVLLLYDALFNFDMFLMMLMAFSKATTLQMSTTLQN